MRFVFSAMEFVVCANDAARVVDRKIIKKRIFLVIGAVFGDDSMVD